MVFDPFNLYYGNLKEKLQRFTSAPIVKVDSLNEGIVQYTTAFLMLSRIPNQQFERGNPDVYALTKKQQELLVRLLDSNNNIHIVSQPLYTESEAKDNPLFAAMKISYAGAMLLLFTTDSACGVAQTITSAVQQFQIPKKDSTKAGISSCVIPCIYGNATTGILK